jgi:hypothetical protein
MSADGAYYALAAGIVAIGLAFVKSNKGCYLRTPCGSVHDCVCDFNAGRPNDRIGLGSPKFSSKASTVTSTDEGKTILPV